jgi:hypothetical protein
MADPSALIIAALGELLQAVAVVVREKPPDAAARLRRATVAITSRRATAEAAREILRRK